jgi:hypothetical protein
MGVEFKPMPHEQRKRARTTSLVHLKSKDMLEPSNPSQAARSFYSVVPILLSVAETLNLTIYVQLNNPSSK